MSYEIKVPELGESIVEATVSNWLKKEGDSVNVGETVVELETDKVDVDVAAEKSGVIKSIAKKEGEDVKIGDVLGTIDESASNGEEEKTDEDTKLTERAEKRSDGGEDKHDEDAETKKEKDERVTPLAGKMIKEHGLDADQIEGTGPAGRITKEDVQNFLGKQDGEKKERAEEQKREKGDDKDEKSDRDKVSGRSERRIRMSRRRQTIAKRLVEAQRTAAMLTTFNELDMSEVMKIRAERKESFEKRHGIKLGFMSFFVKAVVAALKEFPELNAEIQEDEIVYKNYYDIGIAIGAEEGLVVPVIRDADTLSFAAIEKRIRDFAQRAEDGTLTLDDLKGGTFSITNGGVYGSLLSTPILNPPQVGILGLHKIEERPVIVDGETVVRPMMYAALSYDHRIVDGKESVQFLVRIKEFIENPAAMLLEL
jgi:2-oxoglutarate dehydrogenase E2 component (dihydrolipoamide succinyltransferase)